MIALVRIPNPNLADGSVVIRDPLDLLAFCVVPLVAYMLARLIVASPWNQWLIRTALRKLAR